MTQYYAIPKFSLNRARSSIKILITLFLIGTLMATWLSVYTLYYRTGLTTAGIERYYLGNEGDPQAAEILFPKSTGEMLAFFHIHSFTLLLLLFVLCHFVALTTLGEGAKIGHFAASFLSLLGMMGCPWGVRFGGHAANWAAATLGSGWIFVVATIVGGILVLWEMWVRPLAGNGGSAVYAPEREHGEED